MPPMAADGSATLIPFTHNGNHDRFQTWQVTHLEQKPREVSFEMVDVQPVVEDIETGCAATVDAMAAGDSSAPLTLQSESDDDEDNEMSEEQVLPES